ncbi:MAG: sensor domain-containing diguanylate cyclase [Burkholderiales bacterium PBB6]|nr:MAG: sensor domain-containing diguanylate cyclase [Burkholderiales bacterium PBB6]
MPLFRWLSLRQLLTVPYVVLVLMLSLLLGSLSYQAGRTAVDNLSEQLLSETVGRISQAVEKHVFGSGAVLEMAFPRGVTAPRRLADEVDSLRTRFWLATSVHRELNNYAYYGDEQGHFLGVWRDGEDDAQLRLRTASEGPRTVWKFKGIHGALHEPEVEQRVFEPRQRPWYQAASRASTETWTSIYIDFRTTELVATRARRVLTPSGQLGGVVATDVSLHHLSAFVKALPLSRNGIAFVVEPDGNLIATSRGDYLRRGADGRPERLPASVSGDRLLAASYAAALKLRRNGDEADEGRDWQGTRSARIDGPDGESVQLAQARIRDNAGLDWLIVVAVPRHDFLKSVTDNTVQTVLLGLLASGGVVGVGLLSLGVVSRDLRKLAVAARQVGEGRYDTPLNIQRRDEIGDLAQSFSAMKRRLATDRLTGLASREVMLRRIEDRITQQRRQGDAQPFGVLFMDVNGFKAVNDQHGHDTGDEVLSELAGRMRETLRDHDLIARWAGDEFVVLLDNVQGEGDMQAVVHKLTEAFSLPLNCLPEGHTTSVGMAIGTASFPADGGDAPTLIRRADQAMYTDKHRTR